MSKLVFHGSLEKKFWVNFKEVIFQMFCTIFSFCIKTKIVIVTIKSTLIIAPWSYILRSTIAPWRYRKNTYIWMGEKNKLDLNDIPSYKKKGKIKIFFSEEKIVYSVEKKILRKGAVFFFRLFMYKNLFWNFKFFFA